MKLKTFTPIIALLLLVGGCSGKLTVIDFGQEGKAEAGKDGTSGKVINFLVLYTPGSTLSTITEQTTDGQVPISLYGANSATGSQDNPNAVFNPVSIVKEVIETIAPVVPEKAEVQDNDDADSTTWKYTKVYEMQEISHGRPFYRFGIPGEQFGSSVLFTDEKGNTFFIPDTSKDTGDKAQQYFFNGKGEVATFDGNASMFWYSTGSHSITVHFNGVE